jgi:IS30 family transposase
MKDKRMAASIAKPITTDTSKATRKQRNIIAAKLEHPDLSTREIAALANTDHSHVIKTLQRYGIEREHVDNYKRTRADILAGMQDRILNSITDEDIQKSPMGSRILAVAERLQNDLSTQNLASVHSDVAAMKALQSGGKQGDRE